MAELENAAGAARAADAAANVVAAAANSALAANAPAHGEGGYFGIAEDKLTPLFRQYLAIKREHPGAILLYRLGDFYEMFGPDAEHASLILGVMLTAREAAKGRKVPMCGVPHHALMRYFGKRILLRLRIEKELRFAE